MAYEKNGSAGCWIRLRYYLSLNSLIYGHHHDEYDVERHLSEHAEGTPSFDFVHFKDQFNIQSSVIKLRFHFYDEEPGQNSVD